MICVCACVLSFIDTRPMSPMKNCVHSIGIYWNYTIGQTQQQPTQRWQISEAWIGRKMWKVMFSKCSFFGGSWFQMHCITETWRCLNTACFSRVWMQKEWEKKQHKHTQYTVLTLWQIFRQTRFDMYNHTHRCSLSWHTTHQTHSTTLSNCDGIHLICVWKHQHVHKFNLI